MRTRHDIRIAVIVFLAFNLAIAFGSISLLERMTPAIRKVMQANVDSLAFVEEMLSLLAEPNSSAKAEVQQRFTHSLESAKKNITEVEEQAIIESIERDFAGAINGDANLGQKVVAGLRRLGAVNREAMHKADREAVRLGTAGSWIVVLLGSFGFLLSLVILTRLNRQIVRPVEEIYGAVREWKEGNVRRRCNLVDAPPELQNAMSVINQLMDHCQMPEASEQRSAVDVDRKVLVWLLEREKTPAMVLDEQGRIFAANNQAHEVISRDREIPIREEIARVMGGAPSPLVSAADRLESSGFWYFVLKV